MSVIKELKLKKPKSIKLPKMLASDSYYNTYSRTNCTMGVLLNACGVDNTLLAQNIKYNSECFDSGFRLGDENSKLYKGYEILREVYGFTTKQIYRIINRNDNIASPVKRLSVLKDVCKKLNIKVIE